MKTEKQIQKEIKALQAIRPKIRPYSTFRDDNLAALNAQIEVLKHGLDSDDVRDKYDRIDSSEYILESAFAAIDWMNDDEDPDCEGLACEWPLKE